MTDTAEHDGGTVPSFEMRHRMRLALEHAGVSVNEMAELLGVDRNTVGRYLNGHTTPRLSVLRVWAMRTAVPLDWIRFGEAPTPPPTPETTRTRHRRTSACTTISHLVIARAA